MFTYLERPEPAPVGVNVDPLGEAPAPIVLPDGFLTLLGPVLVEPAVEPDARPVALPFTDEPVVVPLTAAPPVADPPAAPPLLWARANVLDSAKAVANAIVESFMAVPFWLNDQG